MEKVASPGPADQIAPLKWPVEIPLLVHLRPTMFIAAKFNFTLDKFYKVPLRWKMAGKRAPEAKCLYPLLSLFTVIGNGDIEVGTVSCYLSNNHLTT